MARPVNIELGPKATKRKISQRCYMNQCVEAPLLRLKSILSRCWQAPAMCCVSPNQPGTCTIKNHLPKHISRHASSLAVPQEDSMCGDGPTTQSIEGFLQESWPAHMSRHASSLAVPQEDSMCGDGPTVVRMPEGQTRNAYTLPSRRVPMNNSSIKIDLGLSGVDVVLLHRASSQTRVPSGKPQHVFGLKSWTTKARKLLLCSRSRDSGMLEQNVCSASRRHSLHSKMNKCEALYLLQHGQRSSPSVVSLSRSREQKATQLLSNASFGETLLVPVGPAKSAIAGRKSRPKSDIPRNVPKSTQPTKAVSSARSQKAVLDDLTAIAAEVIGTKVAADAPLMDSGLDSIGATELSNKMSAHLNTELSPTLLFDHPSLRSIADALSVDHDTEEVLEPEFVTTAEEPRAALELAQRPQQSAKPQSTPAIVETISSTLSDILGTRVATDAPLMSVGLDSISASEFTNALAERFDTELPQTLMFDHPTIDAMASFIAETTEAPVAAAAIIERETVPTTTVAPAVAMCVRAAPERVFLASRRIRFTLPGGCNDSTALKELGLRAWAANSHWPVSRAVELQGASAAYGAFLAPDAFAADTAFFGISRTEARAMDPMAMLVLETTYGALSDSSSDSRANLANAPIGFFLGASGGTGSLSGGTALTTGAKKAPSVYSATSGALSVLSGRLSYTLGLTGPCLTTDTACSAALVATHLAASALLCGETTAAAVAGANLVQAAVSVAFSAAGMLSALGRCHTFDRRADGYCRGEGCGAFYFSTEADDVAVSGTAVQQDGPSASLTAPNGSSQQRLIEAVRAGNGPSLEAHGTGTALGDPIEVRAF